MADTKNPVTNVKGEFIRGGKNFCYFCWIIFFCLNLVTAFRNWIKNDPSAEYPAEENRYHLYVALACPWVKVN
jgi:hypothetical protein